MNYENIINTVKNSFCNLTSFKTRSNALEIVTAYSTMNNKFVSVFITYTKDKIIVTDNGWVDQNYYETPLFEESENIISKVTSSFAASFNVKTAFDKAGVAFNYKVCNSIEEIPSNVFDLANFIVGVVNCFCIQYKDEKEEKERETFRREANDFLKANYSDKLKLRASLDDFGSIKFSAIVNRHSNLFLISYITGSTQYYFENDLRKSIVNFEIALKSKYNMVIQERIALINNTSGGYQPEKSNSIFELLSEKTTREPIVWTEKERILEVV